MGCTQPIRIRGKRKIDGMTRVQGYQIVPCGKCNACRLRRVNDWVLRLQAEERDYIGGLFVTLTYSPQHCPITQKGLMTVTKRDVQLFMKRLRKICKRKIKYYAAAEYGSKTKRPHYHLIMFGADADAIDIAWGLGDVFIGGVTSDSCAYTLKYISKEKQIPAFVGDDRQREFSLSSKNLGKCYLTPKMIEYHKNGSKNYFIKEGGYKACLPRYYKDRIFTQEEKDAMFSTMQDLQRMQFERDVDAAGGLLEYYRQRYELAKLEQQKLKLKHKNSNDLL